MRSWKVFEALLDKKIDTLRLDIFSNSTPLPPPPLTAEAQEALTAAVIEAIRDEMPLSNRSMSLGSPKVEVSSSVLTVLQETQETLRQLRSKEADGLKEILVNIEERLANQATSPWDQEELGRRLAAAIASSKAADAAIAAFDVDAITARLADAIKPQLYSLIDLAYVKIQQLCIR